MGVVAITVPSTIGVGPAADVHTLDPQKSFVLDGVLADGQQLAVEVTEDPTGVNGWVGLFSWTNNNPPNVTIDVVAYWVRVRGVTGSGAGATASVNATTNGTNTYFTLVVPTLAPGASGPGPAVDVSGGGPNSSFSLHVGTGIDADNGESIAVQGSNDNVSWNGLFGQDGKQPPGFLGLSFKYLRTFRNNARGAAMTMFVGTATAAGGGGGGGITQLTGDVTAGPGSGAQAATIAPGAVTLSKMANLAADSLIGNPTGGSATPVAVPLGAGLSFVGGALTATGTGFPGFGGAPPQVNTVGAAGAAGTASRSDHTHAQDLSVVYAPSQAAGQATGVFQQTYAAPNATPAVLTVTTGNIPYGNASVLAQSLGGPFFDVAASHWLALGTNAPNVGGYPAGSRGLTLKATGTDGGALEFVVTADATAPHVVGSLDFNNGAAPACNIQVDNGQSTSGTGRLRVFIGASQAEVIDVRQNEMIIVPSVHFDSPTFQEGGSFFMGQASPQGVYKTGGLMQIGTQDADQLDLMTNNVVWYTLSAAGTSTWFDAGSNPVMRLAPATGTLTLTGAGGVGGGVVQGTAGGGNTLSLQDNATPTTSIGLSSGVATVKGTVVPAATQTYDLGGATQFWANLWVTRINGAGGGTGLELADSSAPTGTMIFSLNNINVSVASFTVVDGASHSIVTTGINAVGFLGAAAAVQQSGGALTAGAVYTATEQNMLNKVYSAVRTFGFIS